MKIFKFYILTVIFLISCKPREKNNQNENWGECKLSKDCPQGHFCKNHRCIEFKQHKIQIKKAPAGMVYIPTGEFIMGSSKGTPLEKPQISAITNEFFIDKTEVSIKDYEKCVKTGRCSPPTCKQPDNKNIPVTCITFTQAKRYCFVQGKRLPNDDEWEKAARGIDARRYPWGDVKVDCTKATYNKCHTKLPTNCGQLTAGQSPYGTLDQAGNVWEWTQTEFQPWDKDADPKMEIAGYKPKKKFNKKHKKTQKKHYYFIRGGSFVDDQNAIRTSSKLLLPQDFFSPYLGFRCVKDIK